MTWESLTVNEDYYYRAVGVTNYRNSLSHVLHQSESKVIMPLLGFA